MASQVQRAGLTSRGFMSFTIADGGLLQLGGSSATVPATHLSGGVSDATGFLAAGIPQTPDKRNYADIAAGDVKGHSIKHATITLISAGAATGPAARYMSDGSTPTTSLGAQLLTGDGRTFENSRDGIFNFKAYNRSGGSAVFEVEVFE